MIKEFSKYFTLFLLILRYGRLRHSPYDVNIRRLEVLDQLQPFIPQKRYQSKLSRYNRSTLATSNSLVRRIASEAAFLKRSIFPAGGHLHLPQYNLSYIRIPKSASTSLSAAMLFANFPALHRLELTTTEINFLTDANLHTRVRENSSEIFFTAVRNPFARIVSVYRDFFENVLNENVFKDYLFGILPSRLSFAQFIDRVALIPDHLLEPHLRPQSLLVDYYTKRQLSVIVLRMDKPGEIDSFLSIYGLSMSVFNASETSYDFRSYYNHEIFDRVASVYQSDIHRFHFEKEMNDLKKFLIDNEQSTGDLK